MNQRRAMRIQAGFSGKNLKINDFLSKDEIQALSRRLSEVRNEVYALANLYSPQFGYSLIDSGHHLWNIIWFECLWALAWLSYSKECGAPGDESELREDYFGQENLALIEAINAVSTLLKIDDQFPQSIGSAISHAISMSFWPCGKDFSIEFSDPNSISGEQRYFIPYREAHFIENQLALRCGFESDFFLSSLQERLIQFRDARKDLNHHQLGCLRIAAAIDKKTRLSFNIEEIGLAARLSLRFREFSAGRYVVQHYPGLEVPNFGKPHWNLVADLVNLTLNLRNPVTPQSLKARWHKLIRKYVVLIDHWPRPATRQPVRVYEPDTGLPA